MNMKGGYIRNSIQNISAHGNSHLEGMQKMHLGK